MSICNPIGYTVHGILQAKILEWVAFPFSRGSSQPRDQTQVFSLQADSLVAEPPGKPKNTGVGSLSLLQWTFPIQELNQGLLHCRWILYQLSHQRRPLKKERAYKVMREKTAAWRARAVLWVFRTGFFLRKGCLS